MKDINTSAPVICSREITINAPAERVWKILTDISNWATWQTDIRRPKLNGELRPGTTFNWTTGGAKIHSTLHTVDPYTHFGWTGKTLGLFAIHNWTLIRNDGNTVVKVDESMEGFIAKVFKRSFTRNMEKGMQSWLELLKKTCE